MAIPPSSSTRAVRWPLSVSATHSPAKASEAYPAHRPRANVPVCPGMETSPDAQASSASPRSPPGGNWTQSSPPVKVFGERQKPPSPASAPPPSAPPAAGGASLRAH